MSASYALDEIIHYLCIQIVKYMPSFIPNILVSDCWGSAGQVTFYHRDGKCFWKNKPSSEFSETEGQLDQAQLHHRALEAWRSLDHKVQELWHSLSYPVVSHRPPFDGTSRISGYNLFVSAYHGFAQLGDEHVPTPAAFEEFPVFVANYAGTEDFDPDGGIIKFRVEMPECLEPERFRLLTKLQFTSPGRGRQPGYLRNFIASENCTSSDCIVSVPVSGIRHQWKVEGDLLQVHCRIILIDSRTGYRSQYKRISFLISL